MDFHGGSNSRESARNAGDVGSIPGLGRSPGEGNGNPLQFPCLENPMDRAAMGLQRVDTTYRLKNSTRQTLVPCVLGPVTLLF